MLTNRVSCFLLSVLFSPCSHSPLFPPLCLSPSPSPPALSSPSSHLSPCRFATIRQFQDLATLNFFVKYDTTQPCTEQYDGNTCMADVDPAVGAWQVSNGAGGNILGNPYPTADPSVAPAAPSTSTN